MFRLLRVLLVMSCFLGMVACSARSWRIPSPGMGTVVPPCATPAPLGGKFDPDASGFIVAFTDKVDVEAKVHNLEARYGFEAESIYRSIGGFFAELVPPVVAQIRCESIVKYVDYNSRVQGSALEPTEN